MKARNFIPIVDLFAGPGGLGEGFSSVGAETFQILVSAEMDPHAHRTLQFRAFYRALLRHENKDALETYYAICNGKNPVPVSTASLEAWTEAEREALQLTLGNPEHNDVLDSVLRKANLNEDAPWVLIGGPPCQAYSIVGRSRNAGKAGYRPEEDQRHFLYREYLRIIQKYRPAVFVMENVKGILSSSIEGEYIFHSILNDLANAGGSSPGHVGYRIHSLSHDVCFKRGMDPDQIDVRKFVVEAEDYGVPQARHRVILLGVREDIIAQSLVHPIEPASGMRVTVEEALMGLPKLRSTLSKRSTKEESDSAENWSKIVRSHFNELGQAAKQRKLLDLSNLLMDYAARVDTNMSSGALQLPLEKQGAYPKSKLHRWYHDPRLEVWLNHETRAHMSADLMRYAYAASFAKLENRSPKGHAEFDLLEQLRPMHANWETGKFSDRFRVQLSGTPSTTITSHISKDGHYFIHPDPLQCRSLTVREAARLQTFPDNYFFQGNRTQQFHQVGNAVPPWLAYQIAQAVSRILGKASFSQMENTPLHKAA